MFFRRLRQRIWFLRKKEVEEDVFGPLSYIYLGIIMSLTLKILLKDLETQSKSRIALNEVKILDQEDY